MYRIFVWATLAIVLMSVDCRDKDEIGALNFNFTATWGAEPVVMGKVMTYDNGKAFKFERFSLYVSDLTLLGANGDEVTIPIDMVDMTTLDTDTKAIAGITKSDFDIVTGSYTGFKIGIGVASEYNAKKPANFDLGHPLANTAEYWDGWQSYIFTRAEGRVSTNNDGIFDFPFVYHTGSDEVFRTKTVNLPIEITADGNPTLKLNFDLKKVLEGIDITSTTGGHTIGDIELGKQIQDAIVNSALTISLQ